MADRRHSGFTLIELLIVVAIISILASIAVPNFLEAQTRAKVARIKADQRTMATAIESYMVDNNKYPIRRDQWMTDPPNPWWAPPLNAKIYDPAYPTAAVGLHVITTPQSYLSSIPSDIFNRPVQAMAQPGNSYSDAIDYWDPKQLDNTIWYFKYPAPGDSRQEWVGKGWALVSVGPDQRIGVLDSGLPGGYPPEGSFTRRTAMIFYDPTNGTVSAGNIFRFAGNLEQRDVVHTFH